MSTLLDKLLQQHQLFGWHGDRIRGNGLTQNGEGQNISTLWIIRRCMHYYVQLDKRYEPRLILGYANIRLKHLDINVAR